MKYFTKIRNNWFLVGLLCAILCAKLYPPLGASGGVLKPEITVKFFAVCIIFFISGLCIKTEDLLKTLFRIRIHCFVQCFSLMFIPLLMIIFTYILSFFGINEWISKGFLVVGCMPPPVSSAVVLTKAVGGDEAVAIFNSAFGSLLGIAATPLLLLSLLGISTGIPLSSAVTQLSLTVILPLTLGQTTRLYIQDGISKSRIPFSTIGSFMLLLIIYTTFCDTFSRKELDLGLGSILYIVCLVVIIQATLMAFIFYITTQILSRVSPGETVAAIFSASHKSLTLGIPMLNILFYDSPNLSTISTPLLIYHPIQILFGSLLIPYLQDWMRKKEKKLKYAYV